MTPSEFKAWFDGFTEAFENRIPSKAQWTRIKERVAEIDGKPVTERVYIDRYYHRYFSNPYPYYTSPTWYGSSISCGANGISYNNQALNCSSTASSFDSHNALSALGRAEALGMGAAQ